MWATHTCLECTVLPELFRYQNNMTGRAPGPHFFGDFYFLLQKTGKITHPSIANPRIFFPTWGATCSFSCMMLTSNCKSFEAQALPYQLLFFMWAGLRNISVARPWLSFSPTCPYFLYFFSLPDSYPHLRREYKWGRWLCFFRIVRCQQTLRKKT